MRLKCGWCHAKEEMVLRIWGFSKTVSWDLTLDHGRRHLNSCHGGRELSFCKRVEFLPSKDVVRFFGCLSTEILNIRRCTARWNGFRQTVNTVRIVSLSSCHYGLKSEVKKPFVSKATMTVLYLPVYLHTPVFVSVSTFGGYLMPNHSPRRTVVVLFNP